MRLAVLCVSCAAGLPLTAAASPQDFDLEAVRATKRAAAVRISEPIVVDGALDEAAWALAEPAGDFYQQFPDEFGPATERSDVRFLYDDDMLYIGAMMYDREPDRLIIDSLRRDFSNFQSDSFLLVFDTFLDRRNGYGFVTNAGGAQRDVQSTDNGRRNDANWDGAWFTRSKVLESGWSTEIAVPFKTLRFPPGDLQQWGLNMQRVIRRKNEYATWSPVPRQFSHYAPGYAGLLTGITGVESGSDLRITPFTTGQFKTGPAGAGAWDGDGDAGMDLKWGVTSSLLLDASYRTDFSQVEADEQQINLTRFSLFFPEKRQFFLESPASFQVGLGAVEAQRRDLVPFFTRRIGLSASGQPTPVIGGLRLTGRAAGNGIGLLSMQTDEFEGDPGANFTIARVRRDLTSRAAVGGFYFGRETTDSRSFNRSRASICDSRPGRRWRSKRSPCEARQTAERATGLGAPASGWIRTRIGRAWASSTSATHSVTTSGLSAGAASPRSSAPMSACFGRPIRVPSCGSTASALTSTPRATIATIGRSRGSGA